MRNILITLLLLLSLSSLFAQYDEKAILFQNAQQLFFQRQYAEAEKVWVQLLQKYPNDISSITQLFQLYLQISKPDKAEKLLNDYRTVMPGNNFMEMSIQLDIQQAKVKEAWDKAQAYIQLGPNEEYRYRVLAGYFERKSFFEHAIRIYEQGRITLKKTDIFTMEIGNCAFNSQIYEKAITEYIRFLEFQPGNLYFVSNQLKSILTENPDLIKLVKNLAQASSSLEVKETYAISLNRMGRLKEALKEYEQLPTEKLTAFALEQFYAGQDSIAVIAFNVLLNKQIDTSTMGDVLLKSSQLYIRMKRFAQAESVLTSIVDPETKKINPRMERRTFPFQAYLSLAELAQWKNKNPDKVAELLNEARKLATNNNEITEVDFRLVELYFVNEQYDEAVKKLEKQPKNTLPDRRLFYYCLISLAKQQTEAADSLLNEMMIAAPSSKYVNDIMVLNILMMNLSKSAQNSFMNAFKHKLNHKDSLAVQILYELSNTAKDEELRILAADWAYSAGFKVWAESIYDYAWQDELLKEYAFLQKSKLQSNTINAESLAQDFLKTNPNSVFSPSFRQILQKSVSVKPSL